jgi:hypothetical protein
MEAELQKIYDQLEIQREELLKKISTLNEENHNHTVRGEWSINQILAHILTSERLSLLYMKKKFQGINDLGDTGLYESLKVVILTISQRLPFRYKAPKLVVDHTPTLSLKEIELHWANTRKELKDFLERIEPHHIKRKIYKHPVAGRLNVVQAIGFLREHIIHHLPQIKRHL